MLNELYNEEEPTLEQEQGYENNEDYHFVTGDIPSEDQLDAFLEEMNVPKEEKGCATEPDPNDDAGDEPLDEEAISLITAKNTADFIVTMIDEGMSAGLAFVSKDPQDNYRAGKEQKKNLKNVFTKLCQEKGAEIPIGWQVFFCLATVYGTKIPYAFDRRRMNIEREQLKKERAALEEERQRISRERDDVEAERRMIRKFKEEEKNNAGTNKTN